MSIVSIRALLAGGLLVLAAVIAAVIVWLRSADSGAADTEPATGAVKRVLFDDDNDGEVGRIIDADTMSPAQSAALADDHVTRAEYESAIWATFECIHEAGYEPLGEPHWNVAGTSMSYSFVSKKDGQQSESTLACQEAHSMLVAMTWARQNTPSEEQLAAADAAMRECLMEGGIPEADVRSAQRFHEFEGDESGVYSTCVRQVSIDFNVGW